MNNKQKTELQDTIIDTIKPGQSGQLLLAPRIGKTRIMIEVIKRDTPLSVLWVSPSRKLVEEDLPAEFVKWRAKKSLKRVKFTTFRSLHKEEGKFELIIFDESQNVTPANLINLNKTLFYRSIIAMTGTPSYDPIKMDIMRILRLNIIYEIKTDKAVDLGILADYTIDVHNVPFLDKVAKRSYDTLSYIIDKSHTGAMFQVIGRMRLIHNSKEKLRMAKSIILNSKRRSLIFAPSVAISEKLCKHTYNGKTDDKDFKRFQNKEIDSIAMVNKGGVGYTYGDDVSNIILMQCDSNRNGLTEQKISRILKGNGKRVVKIHIVCLMGTQDEIWVKRTLRSFNPDKIQFKIYK